MTEPTEQDKRLDDPFECCGHAEYLGIPCPIHTVEPSEE